MKQAIEDLLRNEPDRINEIIVAVEWTLEKFEEACGRQEHREPIPTLLHNALTELYEVWNIDS